MAEDLVARGYANTVVLLGGVDAWRRAGFPMHRAPILDRLRWLLLLLRLRFRASSEAGT